MLKEVCLTVLIGFYVGVKGKMGRGTVFRVELVYNI